MITLYIDGTVRASVHPRKGDRALVYIEKLTEADLAGLRHSFDEKGSHSRARATC